MTKINVKKMDNDKKRDKQTDRHRRTDRSTDINDTYNGKISCERERTDKQTFKQTGSKKMDRDKNGDIE